MPLYRLLLYWGTESTPESTHIERDSIKIGDVVPVEGRLWHVVAPHTPPDAVDPEPDAFVCELAD